MFVKTKYNFFYNYYPPSAMSIPFLMVNGFQSIIFDSLVQSTIDEILVVAGTLI